MLKKLFIVFGAIIVVYIVARLVVTPSEKMHAGDVLQPMHLTNIQGKDIVIPNSGTKWVHLQFRRFAGCPICNLHMHAILKRYPDITAAGIQEVVVFHSPKESLLPYQGKFPFDVIGDPEKQLYAQFGVEQSIFAILDVRAWPAIVKGIMEKDKPHGEPEGGALGLPADFLIAPDGKIRAAHYGVHSFDQWSVDELLQLAK